MAGIVVRALLAGVLVWAALAKLVRGPEARAALETFGIRAAAMQRGAWVVLIALELALAAGIAIGLEAAIWAAVALIALFVAASVAALGTGRGGRPCPCYGGSSTLSWKSVLRDVALVAGLLAVLLVPFDELGAEAWLAIGLGVALLACAGLAVAVAALAREIGLLRLRIGPGSALEIPEEGPELGSRTAVASRLDSGARLGLAVFTSESCRVCHALRPAIDSLRGDPELAVEVFDEGADAAVWDALDVPGSPYAVALGADGAVLAKGTFNNLAQLESVIATAERRAADVEAAAPEPAGAPGGAGG